MSCRSLFAALVAALTGCASSFPALNLASLPVAKDFPGAKWVMLEEEQDATWTLGKTGPELRRVTRERLRVLRPAEVPPIRVTYDRTFETIESIKARVVDADGKEKPVDLEPARDTPLFTSSMLFADSRVRTVPVPPVPVNGVLEWEVVTRRTDMQHFVVTNYFGGVEPTKSSRLVLRAPKSWQVRWKLLAYDSVGFSPTERDEGDQHLIVFERSDLKGVEREPSGPPVAARLPVVIARLETWFDPQEKHPPLTPEELSRQTAAVDEGRAKATPELEATVKRVLTGVEDTPRAKARALYEYVCREIQYCAIEIGLGGWYPHPASDVHAARYGDCKDKANYLHSLLTIAGIASYPAGIYSHDGTPRDFALPSLAVNFNHEIIAVQLPEGLVYADPTWRTVPFGELPPNDQGAPVLPFSAEGHGVLMTPESGPDDNTEAQRFVLKLLPGGDAEGTFQLTATGARALPWKSRWLERTGETRRWVEDQLWVRAPLVREVTSKPEGDFAPRVEVGGTLGARRVATDTGLGTLYVRPMDLFANWLQTWNTRRTSAVIERFAEKRVAEVWLELPPGAKLESTRETRVEGPAGVFTLSSKLEGSTLKVVRTFERRQRKLAVSTLAGFNVFVRDALKAEATPIVIKVPEGAR
ncbi:MAG: DUF3857 domain-containing protein [Myxococcaceae bacterium]